MQNKIIHISLISFFILIGCNNKEEKKEFIARVNDSYLYKDDLTAAVLKDTAAKSEFIRNWITTEVLYKEGIENDLNSDEEFKNLIEKTKKELIKTLWIRKYLTKEKFNYSTIDLEKFYKEHRESFKLPGDAFLINRATFNDENKIIKFRNTVIESNWNLASKSFSKDFSVLEIKSNEIIFSYKIYNASLNRIFYDMIDGEVSIIIPIDENRFSVYQMVHRYHKDDIPDFSAIRDDVEKRFVDFKKKELLDNHIKELFSKNDIEIIK